MTRTGIGLWTSTFVIFIVVALSACAPLSNYHPSLDMCVVGTPIPSDKCDDHALQRFEDGHKSYLLGFVEFDDQGQLFNRYQMDAVIDELYKEVNQKDLLIVVFVHGWLNNADPEQEFDETSKLRTFRNVLMDLSEAESILSKSEKRPKRQIVGVYNGWRGESLNVPILRYTTFWERKNTAHEVGHAGLTEVLSRLERVKQYKDAVECDNRPSVECERHTKLIVVGHSFGGGAVYSALSQILTSRFINTQCPKDLEISGPVECDAKGFGNLIVLVNPAFEALLFSPLSDMATERSYFESQLPVLAVLTSKADWATRYAFPAGRRFSTFFERERDTARRNVTMKRDEIIDEDDANTTAVGHFGPYITHDLIAGPCVNQQSEGQATRSKVEDQAVAILQGYEERSKAWEEDKPGSNIQFNGQFTSCLKRNDRTTGRNPYMVVRVDETIIEGHGNVNNPRMIDFIKQLMLLSSQPSELDKRKKGRDNVRLLLQ